MDRLFQPPKYLPHSDERSTVFLAGPIQGAPNWQTEAATNLLSTCNELVVASPRRSAVGPNFDYDEQVAWEKHHLRRAAQLGSIGFWFAAQDHSLPYEEGRSYAQTSRIEIGRIFGWTDYNPGLSGHVVVGFDNQYTANGGGSQRYIERMSDEKEIVITRTLDEFTDSLARSLD